MRKLSNVCLAGIIFVLILYFLVGFLYIFNVPQWQSPDEPAHYNYIKYVALTGTLPTLQLGDYNQSDINNLMKIGSSLNFDIDSLKYEAHQPPLYYVLLAPVFVIFEGSIIVLRSVSLLLGACVIILSVLVTRIVVLDNTPVILAVAGFVAFLPQHVAMMASINNDSLAEVVILLGVLSTLRDDKPWIIGIIIGLGFLTKMTTYFLIVIGLFGVLYGSSKANNKFMLVLQVIFPSILLGSVFWLRNVYTYGWPDLFGLIIHSDVVIGQPLTIDWINSLGLVEYLVRFLNTTFHSFWGQFGWMTIPMNTSIYFILKLVFVLVIIGCFSLGKYSSVKLKMYSRNVVLMLGMILLVVSQYIWYNLSFVQHQGRYLFPSLSAIALFYVFGISGWTGLLFSRILNYKKIGYWAPVALVPILIVLDIYVLYYVIIPGYA